MRRLSIFLIMLAASSALCLQCSNNDNPLSSGSGIWNLVSLTDKQLNQSLADSFAVDGLFINQPLEPGFTTLPSAVGFLVVGVDGSLEITDTRFSLAITVCVTTGGFGVLYRTALNSAGSYSFDENTITVVTDASETDIFSFSLDGNSLILENELQRSEWEK